MNKWGFHNNQNRWRGFAITSQILNETKRSQLTCLLSAYHYIFMRLSSCGMNRDSTLIHNIIVTSTCRIYLQYTLKAKNKWVEGKGVGMSICCYEEITSVTQITHKQVLYQRAVGETAQVITEEQKTLTIWLAIDCVCYCLRVFGSHRQGSRTG